ncbi:MAG: pilus assembly protein [Deltaproteobacteria bacterium]|nr:MAG: pilus assembly protein [Deltaproteobacteria bacterium]
MKMKIRGQRGGAAAEFAIVLPILLVLLFGIVELGVLCYDKAVITNASREGARAGIVYSFPDPIPDTEIINVVSNYCSDHLITFGATSVVNTTITRTGDSSGDPLSVSVAYRYDFLVLPNLVTALTGGINLVADTVMRME